MEQRGYPQALRTYYGIAGMRGAKSQITLWSLDYNATRPHSNLHVGPRASSPLERQRPSSLLDRSTAAKTVR